MPFTLPCIGAQRRRNTGDLELPDVVEETSGSESDVYWSPPTSEVELYAIFQNKKFRMIPAKDVRSVCVCCEGGE